MINKTTATAFAVFVVAVTALAATPCGTAQPPAWDPQEGSCQGGYFASCQDTNLISDGSCPGSGNTKVCNNPARYKVKHTYTPQYTGRCNSITNPCVDTTPPNPPTILFHDAKQGTDNCELL